MSLKAVSGSNLKDVLLTIRSETQPIPHHGDPSAIEDCWNEVFETIESLEKRIQEADAKLDTLWKSADSGRTSDRDPDGMPYSYTRFLDVLAEINALRKHLKGESSG